MTKFELESLLAEAEVSDEQAARVVERFEETHRDVRDGAYGGDADCDAFGSDPRAGLGDEYCGVTTNDAGEPL